MIAQRLAAHPRTPRPVLAALCSQAASERRHPAGKNLTAALATNPSLSTNEQRGLLAQDPTLARTVIATCAEDTRRVLDLLMPGTPVAVARTAVKMVPAPQVADRAVALHPRSLNVASAVLVERAAPLGTRVRSACLLAKQSALAATTAEALVTFLRELHLEAPAHVSALEDALAAVDNPAATQIIDSARAMPGPARPAGGPAWFLDPRTTAEEVAQWALSVGTPSAWTKALRDYTDTSAHVARTALAAGVVYRWPLERIVRSMWLPTPLREQAARTLHDGGRREWTQIPAVAQLMEVATDDFVSWYLENCSPTATQWAALVSRATLAPLDVETLDAARVLLCSDGLKRSQQAALLVGPLWSLWVASYPTTSPRTRAGAVRDLAGLYPPAFLEALEALDAPDPDALLAAARTVPLTFLPLTSRECHLPGVRMLSELAVDDLLGRLTPDAITAALLLESGSFETLNELVAVAHAVTTDAPAPGGLP